MKILVISDGIPGHYKKSAAVSRILSERMNADVRWVRADLRVGAFRLLMRAWLNCSDLVMPPATIRSLYRVDGSLHERPDLIISSGGRTSFLNAWLARWHDCRNILIGAPRALDDRHFWRIVLPDQAFADDPRYIVTLPPVDVDRSTIDNTAAEFRRERDLPVVRRWSLLIGGDGAGYRFARADWERLRDDIVLAARQHAVRWLITTSRRSGAVATDVLDADCIHGCCDDLFLFGREEHRSVVAAYLGCAEAVFCTEDSVTMMTEAIASGRRVFALRPNYCQPEQRHIELLNTYESNGYIQRLQIGQIAERTADTLANRTGGLLTDPLEELANQLVGGIRNAA